MPTKSANVKNEKQYEALKDKRMSKERAAKIANSPNGSKHGGGKASHSARATAVRVARQRSTRRQAARVGRLRPGRSSADPRDRGSRPGILPMTS